MTETTTTERGQRKSLTGIVVSDSMDRTIVVRVERLAQHPKYKKYIRIRKKFYAHDENNVVRAGDKVEIIGTRPLSKTKRWRLVRIIETGDGREIEQ